VVASDVRRVRNTYFSSDDGLLTMGLATLGHRAAASLRQSSYSGAT
jgi:hypothetical protein